MCMQALCVYAGPMGEFAIPVSPAGWTSLGGVGRGTSASSPGDCYLVSSAWGSPSAPWLYRPSQFEIFIFFRTRFGSARVNAYLVVMKEDATWLGASPGLF